MAGLGLAGTPLTGCPPAHIIASMMSDDQPPQWPRARAMNTRDPPATPATPTPLFVRAAIVPATWVPCQLDGMNRWYWLQVVSVASLQSPSSAGLASRPEPSRAMLGSVMKS